MSEPEGAEIAFPKEFQQSPDYAVVYADGAILQLGYEVSRLVFFQEKLTPNEDGDRIEKEKRCIRLMFEVRLPHSAINQLASAVNKLFDVRNKALASFTKSDNPERAKIMFRFGSHLGRLIYNTEDTALDSKAVQELNDEYEDLQLRLTKKSTKVESEGNKPSESN